MIISMPYEQFHQQVLWAITLGMNEQQRTKWNGLLAKEGAASDVNAIVDSVLQCARKVSESYYDEALQPGVLLTDKTGESLEIEWSDSYSWLREDRQAWNELPLAADYTRLPVFHRNINVIDIVFDILTIALAEFGSVLLLYILSQHDEAMSGSPLPIERFLATFIPKLGFRLRKYVRDCKSLPALEGFEHCVYIKSATSFEIDELFSGEQVVELFNPEEAKCSIPARRYWRCEKRAKAEGASAVVCELSRLDADSITHSITCALGSLAEKEFLAPDASGDKMRYRILHPNCHVSLRDQLEDLVQDLAVQGSEHHFG